VVMICSIVDANMEISEFFGIMDMVTQTPKNQKCFR
jgi:hypothetical protein